LKEDTAVGSVRRKEITDLFTLGKRVDKRELTEYRQIKVEQGIIERAEGSARVMLGDTDVIVGIKIELGEPFLDTPNQGVLTVNAELTPLASSTFEPGPPDEQSIELARVVDRTIRESKMVDLEKLCLIPKKKVFVVFVDIHVINYDGNLIDASAIAAVAALINTKLFNYEIKGEEVTLKPGYTFLPIVNYPVPVTIVKVGDKLVVDPSREEEEVMDARLTIAIDKNQKVCAVQKGGIGCFTAKEISEANEIAKSKAEEIRKILVKE